MNEEGIRKRAEHFADVWGADGQWIQPEEVIKLLNRIEDLEEMINHGMVSRLIFGNEIHRAFTAEARVTELEEELKKLRVEQASERLEGLLTDYALFKEISPELAEDLLPLFRQIASALEKGVSK